LGQSKARALSAGPAIREFVAFCGKHLMRVPVLIVPCCVDASDWHPVSRPEPPIRHTQRILGEQNCLFFVGEQYPF
jgi:hypothetical protein